MTTSPPHKRARTSSPPFESASNPPLPTRDDIAMLSSEARLDLILALLGDNPAAASIITSHITAEKITRQAEDIKSNADQNPLLLPEPLNFDHILAKVKPRLKRFKCFRGTRDNVDEDSEKLKRDVGEGVAEIMAGCAESDHSETRRSALTVMAAIAKQVIDSRNEYVRRDATPLGVLIATSMSDVLESVHSGAEMRNLKAEFNEDGDELEDLYESHAPNYSSFEFSNIDAIFSHY